MFLSCFKPRKGKKYMEKTAADAHLIVNVPVKANPKNKSSTNNKVQTGGRDK